MGRSSHLGSQYHLAEQLPAGLSVRAECARAGGERLLYLDCAECLAARAATGGAWLDL